jgi:large subunit ribosomal protein L2
MGVKIHNPTSAGTRFRISADFAEITKTSPEKSLTAPVRKTAGRNAHGHVTSRFRGGGHKQRYRRIDFYRRDRAGVQGKVLAIEYDPNRSARLALVGYPEGERRYILWPDGLAVGDAVSAGEDAEVKTGNALPLRRIPPGLPIHNLELVRNRGGQLVRSAGSSAAIQAKEGEVAHVRLPSGETRIIRQDCWATVGQVGNADHKSERGGKAGHSNWKGRKPHVRGVAMNPIDHPHGGGEGKSGQGNPHPVSPWGWHTKGRKTRRRVKYSNRSIVKRTN